MEHSSSLGGTQGTQVVHCTWMPSREECFKNNHASTKLISFYQAWSLFYYCFNSTSDLYSPTNTHIYDSKNLVQLGLMRPFAFNCVTSNHKLAGRSELIPEFTPYLQSRLERLTFSVKMNIYLSRRLNPNRTSSQAKARCRSLFTSQERIKIASETFH